MELLIAVLILFALMFNVGFALWACLSIRRYDREAAGAGTFTSEHDLANEDVFLVKPYVQLGADGGRQGKQSLEILWHARGEDEDRWIVTVKRAPRCRFSYFDISWIKAQATDVVVVGMQEEIPAHKQFRARVAGLNPAEKFQYEVRKNDRLVFAATAQAPKSQSQPYRFVAVGDAGDGKGGQKAVAYQINQLAPDFVVMPGDIVYKRGRMSEYLKRWFPIMNNDQAAPDKGAPLLRSTLFITVPGNHDFGKPDPEDVPNLDNYPDLFSFFVFWSQPLNGPALIAGDGKTIVLGGAEDRYASFAEAAGGRFPRMASFSFDYGNAHWTVLDSNPHMDWTDPLLREWLEKDLAGAQDATWKFVMFHQPGFTSHTRHSTDQRMRLVADIFQKHGVDVVFNGHAHWYERTFPLTFTVAPQPDGRLIGPGGQVDGESVLDREFDGVANTTPRGILYLVSGAGGAKLHQDDMPVDDQVMPFTQTLIGDRYSFTVCDVDGRTLFVRQMDADGTVIDQLMIAK